MPLQSSRFSDAYEVYVDYGKGKPIKMNKNEATFIDVEKFLIEQIDQKTMMTNKKFYENKLSNKNVYKHDLIINNEESLIGKVIRRSNYYQYGQENISPPLSRNYQSNFTPDSSPRHSSNSSSSTSSSRTEPKIIYDDTWLTNKQYNPRINAFLDYVHDRFNNKTKQLCTERKSTRSSIHEISPRSTISETIYPIIKEKKLCLHIAVNGVSKSLRGQIPLSNLNINNGDFGDDAGMFVDTRNSCFVGLADGAGGNRSLGINPADFSQAVLSACRNLLRKHTVHSKQLPALLLAAMDHVEASAIRGSSTLCLLALDKQEHTLTSLNIGDSGFVIYRNNEIYRRSTSTMNPNGAGPRQLFSLNDSLGLPCFINENEILRDCSLDTMKVQKGDVIILSSDGLWDVIKTDQLQQIIKRNTNNYLQNLADDLLNQAVEGYIVDSRDDILIIACRVDEV
ncbi:unnamed protein product [Adineta steineri]|uniref:Protein phosphatase n=1 Tax=Adineta steineri TaxID=433720 RepID=A0A819C8B7_9BILA|nr:unnamed protein product [Adineta steineri]CAF3807463.1 unnamed protein product [Adineta steineri]